MTGVEEAAAIAAAVGSAAAEAGGAAAAAAPAVAGAGLGTGLGLASEAAIGAGTGAALTAAPSIPAGVAASLAGAGPASASSAWSGLSPMTAQNIAGAGTPIPPAATPGSTFDFGALTKNDLLMEMLQGVMKSAKGPQAPPVPGMDLPQAAPPPQTAAMQALARFKPRGALSIGGGAADPTTALLLRLLRGA